MSMTGTPRDMLRKFILEDYLFTDDQDALRDDMSFLEEGILDSMGILEIIVFLEEEFGVAVANDEMIPANLDSIANLLGFIERKRKAA
jgi:acyl carrier protein